MQTIEQLRAKHALEKICNPDGSVKELKDKYKSYVSALPANILQNGFGQAMAMELAADKDKGTAHKELYRHIQSWLCDEKTTNPNTPYKGKPELIMAIVNGKQSDYIQAQTEVMAYLEWLKKFAAAYLTDD